MWLLPIRKELLIRPLLMIVSKCSILRMSTYSSKPAAASPPLLGLELPTSISTFGPVPSRTKSELTRIRGGSLRRAVYIGAVSYWTPDLDLLGTILNGRNGYRDCHLSRVF